MVKKLLVRFFTLFIIVLLCGCESVGEVNGGGVSDGGGGAKCYTISATIPTPAASSSRVGVDGISVTWSEDDKLTVAKISIADNGFATIVGLLEFPIVEGSISGDKKSASFVGDLLDDDYYYMAMAFGEHSDGFKLIYDGVGSYNIDMRMASIDEQSRMAVKSELFVPADSSISTLSFENIFSLFEFDYRVDESDDKEYEITEIQIESTKSSIYQLVQFDGYDQDLRGCSTDEISKNIKSPEGFSTRISRDVSNKIKFYAYCINDLDATLDESSPSDLKVTVKSGDGKSSSVDIEGVTLADIRNGIRYTKELRFVAPSPFRLQVATDTGFQYVDRGYINYISSGVLLSEVVIDSSVDYSCEVTMKSGGVLPYLYVDGNGLPEPSSDNGYIFSNATEIALMFEENVNSSENVITFTFKVSGEDDFVVQYVQAAAEKDDTEITESQLSDLVDMVL